ncbi:MAG TPA: glycosyltransferase family 2 protein [Pseudacidobacterium sp.]|jgi:glycosyltransferase involved in cell wall biosynthesis|nr:glycosyltransferase family 2 protein [Pseudacidobacterium sp.]
MSFTSRLSIHNALPVWKEIPRYVIITPARNEAQFIELTLQSMITQTHRPLKWVIVSDGSTDGTDETVLKYSATNPWIELLRMPERAERHFAGKAYAFNAGYERVKHLNFSVVGNLDADVSFDADLFELLIARFNEDPQLGVAGAPFREGDYQYDYRFTSINDVWGGCQFFRRECLEAVGGYLPLKGGGVDLVAVVTARMNGWQTRTYTERICIHHRKMNTAMNKGLRLKFKWGQKDYRLGSHPLWQLFRCTYQMKTPPYIVGGLLNLAGYLFSMFTGQPRSVSAEFVEFRGKEQMRRLKSFFTGQRHVSPAEAVATPVIPMSR